MWPSEAVSSAEATSLACPRLAGRPSTATAQGASGSEVLGLQGQTEGQAAVASSAPGIEEHNPALTWLTQDQDRTGKEPQGVAAQGATLPKVAGRRMTENTVPPSGRILRHPQRVGGENQAGQARVSSHVASSDGALVVRLRADPQGGEPDPVVSQLQPPGESQLPLSRVGA